MYNVIQLFAKFGVHILFVVLEIICFYLIINYNQNQNEIFLNSSNIYSAKIGEQRAILSNFANLRRVNDSLMHQNANLIENLILIEYASDNIPDRKSVV